MGKKYFITAAIPYVNAKPHIGHALEFVQTNTIARFHRLIGEDVLSLSGGDENALKNVQAAEANCVSVSEFVNQNTKLFHDLSVALDAEFDEWIKTSDQKHHFPSSQKLWSLCEKNGDIYKKKYEGLYCVGCETFYEPSELNENGECFEHPGKKLEKVSEENYFFALSKYGEKLTELIESDEIKIIPENRKKEMLTFIKEGLTDISISRSNDRAKNWGVPVPGDPSQRMYVWMDALNTYQSGVGFGWDETKYKKWWPADLHVIGKGILRFHAIYWPAFLLSAHLALPRAIFVHDYFTVNGQKMSKTLGNVIDPLELIEKYDSDPLRYYFLAKFSPFNDGDFSEEKFRETYNADLANGLGNLVARIAKLCEKSQLEFLDDHGFILLPAIKEGLDHYRFDKALESLWEEKIKKLDKYLNDHKPWEKQGPELETILTHCVQEVREIAFNLIPFLPQTAEKIQKQFGGEKITSGPSLFPRLA